MRKLLGSNPHPTKWTTLKNWIVGPELEIILHPSRRRLQMVGIFTVIGHVLFWWLWTYWFPQPFEDWRLRLLNALLALGLVIHSSKHAWRSREMAWYFSVACWIQLPVFFVWMYLMNELSAMWMATVALMIVIYYQLTDWRIATLGLVSGFATAFCIFAMQQKAFMTPPNEHSLVFIFAWLSAMILALSSANLRRERLHHALTVIGIMAHELRTPLASLAMIAQALRLKADSVTSENLIDFAKRIEKLTRMINHHIDLQMANAHYSQHHPRAIEQPKAISALTLVNNVIQEYPFDSQDDRTCVVVSCSTDFHFVGSERQFTQVLNNLIKNALHALKVKDSLPSQGDLAIRIQPHGLTGVIWVDDQGIGMPSHLLPYIFEPFYSTANETGNGLGLAFCKQVLQAAQGQIEVHSELGKGTRFTLLLPIQTSSLPTDNTSEHDQTAPVSPA